MNRTWLIAAACTAYLCSAAPGSMAQPDRRATQSEIQNRAFLVIQSNCLACHGSLRNSDLDLRTRQGLLKGGSRGPAVIPGRPEQSRLYRFAAGLEKITMPPVRRLSRQDVETLRIWISAGAPFPSAPTGADRPWAFQSIQRPPIPPTRQYCKNPIDSFLLYAMTAKRIEPAPEADRRTILRRLTFDLTGLPPTPEELDSFVADTSPSAYERVVDRLLASQRYGERWARHWLDLARFAESEGFKSDEMRPTAWRYRDYVIRSLNDDKPYDRFIQEQIAGDELFPGNPDALIATGFCRHWPDESNAQNLKQRRQEILNDITDTTGAAILGLTMGCARCHDHKYDPITQKDYYRLQAFFAGVRPRDDLAAVSESVRVDWEKRESIWEAATAGIRARMAELAEPVRKKTYSDRLKRFPADVQLAIATDPDKRDPMQWLLYYKAMPQLTFSKESLAAGMKPDAKKEWVSLSDRLAAVVPARPDPLPTAIGITDVGSEAPDSFTLSVGSYDKPKERVEPGVLTILNQQAPRVKLAAGVESRSTGRRAALAEWLVSPRNPFTARVIVNRVWQYHFGKGLVATSSDLGAAGDRPTNPALLDWLASELMTAADSPSGGMGWSLKRLHKLIVMSSAYRRSSESARRSMTADPEDHLLWRFPRRRLEGEAIRDAALSVSGTLNEKMGGPSVMPSLPAGLTTRGYWRDSPDPAERNRRSIYVFVKRNMRFPLFEAFDMPDTHESCSRRDVTTTAPQALMLLNDESILTAARHFAGRVIEAAGADPLQQIRIAYRLAFCRLPTEEEIHVTSAFLKRQTDLIASRSGAVNPPFPPVPEPKAIDAATGAALVDLCHALLNSNEFVYIE